MRKSASLRPFKSFRLLSRREGQKSNGVVVSVSGTVKQLGHPGCFTPSDWSRPRGSGPVDLDGKRANKGNGRVPPHVGMPVNQGMAPFPKAAAKTPRGVERLVVDGASTQEERIASSPHRWLPSLPFETGIPQWERRREFPHATGRAGLSAIQKGSGPALIFK